MSIGFWNFIVFLVMQNYLDFLKISNQIVYLDYYVALHTGDLFSECVKNYIHPLKIDNLNIKS